MSTPSKMYDVFISFRGDDTRVGFTSHLYDALTRKSINTYIDDLLNRGIYIWPELSAAIENAHISIVVFSENFANSKWCLKELTKVLECRKKYGQVVIPVFYNTDPSHIRKQTDNYEKAFAKHERSENHTVLHKWKAALTEAANISGWDTRNHKDEANVIQKIVNDVFKKLQLRYPNELFGFVSNEKNSKCVESLLKSVQKVGIWGMGGMGKTTIAKLLFAKHFAQYDHVCFANAKEYSVSRLLSELLKEEISPSDVATSSTLYIRRLRSSKVFIVVDNVECSDQFEYLCRDFGELHKDSRLIITTRDRQLLSERVDWIYEVKQWDDRTSVELFAREAFVPSHPRQNYKHLLERAITYAGGVPLALKVFALLLRGKEVEFWESAFKKLDKHSNAAMNKVLKLSYDDLDTQQKKMFLDIAFFFRGENIYFVARILEACDFVPGSDMDVLVDKALLTVSNNYTIQMHDLLHKMCLDIICNDCGTDPATHTRLSGKAALEVIEENKGSGSIEGITLDLSQINHFPLSADTFTKMKGLRILKFYANSNQSCANPYLNLPEFLEPFSNKLRYFEWKGYPFESLPQPFCAKFLVQIRLPHSNVKQLWQGIEELGKLELIDLSECKQFEKLPNLAKAPSLKCVNLSGCENLVDLDPSLLCADMLTTLILDRCKRVRRVRGEKHLFFLENISVDGCTSLEEFAVSSDLIENLDLSSTGIQTLDLSIGLHHTLKRLNLESLKLKHLPKALSSVSSIRELKISGSTIIFEKQQLHELFDGLRSLRILHMKDFINQFELPNNVDNVSNLMELNLDGSNMKRLPESIKKLEKLEILSLVNCRELECIPELPPLITLLNAVNCTSLVSVSSLKNLATKMMGKTKHISFSNSLNLDGHSHNLIMESFRLTLRSAVFQNAPLRNHLTSYQNDNYNSVDACQPGTSIPSLFQCRTSTDSSITITLLPDRSHPMGFIYSVVLSQAAGNGMKQGQSWIKCQCNLGEEGIKVSELNFYVTELNSDHVYVWYDPYHCDSILKFYKPEICFEFCVTNDTGEVDGSIGIKECGVGLVSYDELKSVLPELELDSGMKKQLKVSVKYASGKTKGVGTLDYSSLTVSDVEERSSGKGRQRKTTKPTKGFRRFVSVAKLRPSSSLEVSKIKSKSSGVRGSKENARNSTEVVKSKGNKGTPVEPDEPLPELVGSQLDKANEFIQKSKSVEQDNESESHIFNVEESIRSSNKETNTNAGTSHEENVTNSAKVFKNTGNEGRPTQSEARLHLPVMPAVEENVSGNRSSENNYDRQDNFDDTKYSEDKPNLQGAQIIVPDTNDLISEPEQENAPKMNLSKPESEEDGSDVDPIAELERILLGSPESSRKATCYTSDVSVGEALHNLKCLLENSLESILSNEKLQWQLDTYLECIKQASDEKVSPDVVKLVQKMTFTIENLFEDFVTTKKVVEDHINLLQQKEKFVQLTRNAKKQQESKQKEMSQFEDEVKNLKEEGKKLDEKVRILGEHMKGIELKEIKAKESMERCESEKKKVENEAKNMITEIKELMLSIKNSKSSYAAALSKQQKLKDKWVGFGIAFAERETFTQIKWPRLIYLFLASLGGIAFLALFGFGIISITRD